ncbi:MAG: transcriptional regulator [Saprospirales bacterium]|nr:MAG: transcriptional regulator [Saprospirales bacterium]
MKDLDPLLHNQLRLAIMSLLVANEHISFNFILEKTGASRGNVSVQISKLEKAGYLKVKKSFVNKKPLTTMNITSEGLDAMDNYTKALKDYLDI